MGNTGRRFSLRREIVVLTFVAILVVYIHVPAACAQRLTSSFNSIGGQRDRNGVDANSVRGGRPTSILLSDVPWGEHSAREMRQLDTNAHASDSPFSRMPGGDGV